MTLVPLTLCGLAAYRLARVIALDSITEPFRAWLYRHAYPGARSGVRDTRRPWSWLYGLLSCCYCCGLWISVLTYAAWTECPSWSHWPITAAAVAGAQATFTHFDPGTRT